MKNNFKNKKPRPTHFLSLRVKDKKIWETIETFQNKLITFDSKFESCQIPKHDSHITLLVVSLKQEEDVKLALKALEETKKILKNLEK